MKILVVTTELATDRSPSGGLANSVARLTAGLFQFGHRTLVLGPGNSTGGGPFGVDGAAMTTFPTKPPSWIRWVDAMLLKRLNLALTAVCHARAVARRISELTESFRPDIILYPNLGGIGLFRPSRIPSIIRISSDTRSCWSKGGYDNQSSVAMLQQITLENAALKRADAAYAPSALTASCVTEKLKRPVDVLRTPFFLETRNEDESVHREHLSGRKYLIFVGLLNRLKGVPDIAETLPLLLSRHPHLSFVFVGKEHAGFAGKTMQNHVLGLAGDLSNRVLFLGELPHNQLFPLIRGAEAVVLPSLVDNFPNACLEAMALGKIVVGTQGTSFEELLEAGVSGVLCRPGDPESLEHAVEQVLALSEEEVRSMGRQAVKTVRQFEPDKTIPPLVAYFENVKQNHSHRIAQDGN